MKVKHEFVWSWHESQTWICLVMTWKSNMNLSGHDMKIKHEFVWPWHEKFMFNFHVMIRQIHVWLSCHHQTNSCLIFMSWPEKFIFDFHVMTRKIHVWHSCHNQTNSCLIFEIKRTWWKLMTWKSNMNLSDHDMKVKHEFVWSWHENQAWMSCHEN
jgi:hypothetical protein